MYDETIVRREAARKREGERACKVVFEAPQGGSRVKTLLEGSRCKVAEVERGRDGFSLHIVPVGLLHHHYRAGTESAMLRANAGKRAGHACTPRGAINYRVKSRAPPD